MAFRTILALKGIEQHYGQGGTLLPEFCALENIMMPQYQIITGSRGVANCEVEINNRKTGARETLTIEAAINRLVG